MIHLMELELRKVNIRPYIYAGFAAILCTVSYTHLTLPTKLEL